MDELDEIQQTLTTDKMAAAFAKVHSHLAQSVERHEAQHRLDLSGTYVLPMPKELEDYVGELPEGYLGEPGLASGALAELSAYLSELGRDPLTTQINLGMLAGYLFNRRAWGMGECYAALVVFEVLADAHKIEHTPFVERRKIQQAEVARVYLKLAALPSEELTASASKAWEKLFGRPLPELELIAR